MYVCIAAQQFKYNIHLIYWQARLTAVSSSEFLEARNVVYSSAVFEEEFVHIGIRTYWV